MNTQNAKHTTEINAAVNWALACSFPHNFIGANLQEYMLLTAVRMPPHHLIYTRKLVANEQFIAVLSSSRFVQHLYSHCYGCWSSWYCELEWDGTIDSCSCDELTTRNTRRRSHFIKTYSLTMRLQFPTVSFPTAKNISAMQYVLSLIVLALFQHIRNRLNVSSRLLIHPIAKQV
jgi:hypothetical protein